MWQHSKIDEEMAMSLLMKEEEILNAELNEYKKNHKEQIQVVRKEEDRHYNQPNSCENRMDKIDKRLTKIQEAIERVKNGIWGFCQVCQREIPAERLELRPWIEYCTYCKGAIESRQKVGGRFIKPPSFAHLFNGGVGLGLSREPSH